MGTCEHLHQHEAVATSLASESPTFAEDRPRDGRRLVLLGLTLGQL